MRGTKMSTLRRKKEESEGKTKKAERRGPRRMGNRWT